MATTIPTTEPTAIQAGDTVAWTKNLTDYLPSASWVLTYQYVSPAQAFTLTAADNSDGTHLITELPAATDDWAAGNYQWQAYVTKASNRYTVDSGRAIIRANLAVAAATGADYRTQNKRTLDLINAAIEDRFPLAESGFSINGRSVELMSMPDLIQVRNLYHSLVAAEIKRERRAQGKSNAGRIGVRF